MTAPLQSRQHQNCQVYLSAEWNVASGASGCINLPNAVPNNIDEDLSHGLINFKDTKTKSRLHWRLIELIDWRYSQSCWSCWLFRPSFVNYCPSNLLSGSPPPPHPSQRQSTDSRIYRQCVPWGGVGVLSCFGDQSILCTSLTLSLWPDLEPTKLLHHPK